MTKVQIPYFTASLLSQIQQMEANMLLWADI